MAFIDSMVEKLKDVLMIMAAREIAQAVGAFRRLPIDKCWFRGYTEGQLEEVIPCFIQQTRYDNYILASDDLVPTSRALEVVLSGLRRHPVFTGWCNVDKENGRMNVRLQNLRGRGLYFEYFTRIAPLRNLTDWAKLYTFPLPSAFHDSDDVPVYFMGFAFSGMRRELWLRYPFKAARSRLTNRSFASDYVLSHRLARDHVGMYTTRDAYFYHLASTENMIVGKVRPHMVHEVC